MKTAFTILLLLIALLGCLTEIYFLITFIRSSFGKYPPFIISFGKAKNIVIYQAKRFLEQAPKSLHIYDLGCGSGSLLLPLAKEFSQHQFTGYEWDWLPYLIAKIRCRKYPNIKIIKADFMLQNYNDAGLILCYTGATLSHPLGEKLNNELPAGSLVISEAFKLDHLPPKETLEAPTIKMPIKIFLYQK